ncbi:MAG TPA: prolyl oligopeptidase family serine peptidase, partial [Actinospica sp.]|nr:prolyl oligopeptidase family serine peptidase [Actinospica sp.]
MSTSSGDAAVQPPAGYPEAERLDLVEELHGHRIADPYRWLEDVADPRTETWSGQQDALFTALQAGWLDEERREAFRARLAELADAGYAGPPTWRGRHAFFSRRDPGQEHSVLLTADADSDGRTLGAERVLLDPGALDPSGLTTLDGHSPSPDGALLAYLLSEGGTEESLLRVIDVATGELVDGPIDRARYSPVAWLADGKGFYYARRLAPDQVPEDESQFHRRVYLHRLGTDTAEDVLIFGEGLEKTNYYEPDVSHDGRWLSVVTNRGTAPRNDLHVADLSAGEPGRPRLIALQQDIDAQTYLHVGRDGRFYLFTDRDAGNFRLCVLDPGDAAEPAALAYERWQEVLPEDPEAVLGSYAILDGAELERPLVLAVYSCNAVSELRLFDLETGERLADIPTPGPGTIPSVGTHPDGGPRAWLAYTSFDTPFQAVEFDARTRELSVWAAAPGAIELGALHVRRVRYPSKDGTQIQLTILSGAPEADRPRPTILYGYGGFDISLTPGYSAQELAWVEAGGVFAIANLRGGSEGGQSWHRAGMLGNKQNVFDDFHAAGDWLVRQGWTTREQLGIFGGSNGGLLVGAALTQRPQDYAAVVCSAPLLDMLRYELFGLGATWNVEYGSASVPEEFEWL